MLSACLSHLLRRYHSSSDITCNPTIVTRHYSPPLRLSTCFSFFHNPHQPQPQHHHPLSHSHSTCSLPACRLSPCCLSCCAHTHICSFRSQLSSLVVQQARPRSVLLPTHPRRFLHLYTKTPPHRAISEVIYASPYRTLLACLLPVSFVSSRTPPCSHISLPHTRSPQPTTT